MLPFMIVLYIIELCIILIVLLLLYICYVECVYAHVFMLVFIIDDYVASCHLLTII